MNRARVIVLGLAALAAIAAVFLVKGLLSSGSEKVQAVLPPRPATNQVLVAATALQAGTILTPEVVKWQTWPRSAVDASFITHELAPDLPAALKGTVLRAPLQAGQPLTTTEMVHAEGAGFLSATVTPGMRAMAVGINPQFGAGGFILPNDRVDVIVTIQISDMPRRFATKTVAQGVRVLAVDQTARQDKDQKFVIAETATLELTSLQAERVSLAQAAGALSLSLRALGDVGPDPKEVEAEEKDKDKNSTAAVTIIRYGVSRLTASDPGE